MLAVAFGILPATAFSRPAPAAADTVAQVPDTAPDEATAGRYAGLAHKRVQVLDQTNETAETFANPDGTFTTTRHLRPVRVKRDGGWVTPDSTLAPQGGVFAAKAATTGVTLSAGKPRAVKTAGAQPLLRLTRDGTTAGFDWTGTLPEPVVTGSTATYPEILPGVDLRVEVDLDTVHEVVVVKTPEAAKNVTALGFGVPVQNGTVVKDADGSLHVRDAKGEEKFGAPPATMWDSSGIDPDGRDFTRGPAPGGHRAAVGVDLAGTKLTLTPDQKLLTAPDTVYPVYVDPTWHDIYCQNCGRNHYLVQYACGSNKSAGDAVWDSDDNLRAGYVNDPNSTCNKSHLITARSFVEMNLGGLAGKKIYGAQLSLSLTNPGRCERNNDVVWSGGISAGMAFNSGPSWWSPIRTVVGCPANAGFDITDVIANAVGGNSPTWTFGLVSPNEGDDWTWKRYSTQIYFSVTYNSPPNQPANLAVFNGTQSYPCVQGASRPVLGPTSTGYVTRANVSDPDGNALDARFRIYKGLVSKGGYTWDGREFGSDNILSDGNQANRNAVTTLPKDEMNADGFYSWDVHSFDGKDTSWAVPCEAEVELTPPAVPGVASQTYPSGAYGGGPGRAGDFTFTPAGTAAPVDHYVWRLDNTASPSCNGTEAGTVTPKALNGPGTTAIAPGSSGPHVLSAWSCNRAKTPSNRVDYAFTVKDAAAPVASWQFEGDGRSQVTGLRYAGAGTGNFAAGKLGQAAVLSGQSGDYFETPARIVDTAKSFSVSAWVNVADLSGRRAFLSQDGDQTSGFALQYLETGKWAFSLSGADVASPTVTSAVSATAPAAGTWTHLTGVYDVTAHTAALYVGGALQQTVFATAANVTGPLVLGGAKSGGARAYLAKGSIDEAVVVGRALSASEVSTLYGANGVPAGLNAAREYTLDGDPKDATGTENTLELHNLAYGPGYSGLGGPVGDRGRHRPRERPGAGRPGPRLRRDVSAGRRQLAELLGLGLGEGEGRQPLHDPRPAGRPRQRRPDEQLARQHRDRHEHHRQRRSERVRVALGRGADHALPGTVDPRDRGLRLGGREGTALPQRRAGHRGGDSRRDRVAGHRAVHRGQGGGPGPGGLQRLDRPGPGLGPGAARRGDRRARQHGGTAGELPARRHDDRHRERRDGHAFGQRPADHRRERGERRPLPVRMGLADRRAAAAELPQ